MIVFFPFLDSTMSVPIKQNKNLGDEYEVSEVNIGYYKSGL